MVGIPITALGHLAHALFPLLLLALVLRRVGPSADPSAPWCTRRDLGLAAVCGLGATALSTLWMDRYFVHQAALTASDFGQYCESVDVLRAGTLDGWVKQRSVVAGVLPSVLAKHLGIVDALLVAAMASHTLMVAGLYLWARGLHSRLAGVAAAMLACGIAPLVHLTRTVTFYPEAVAAYVLSAAGAVLAIRYRTLPAIAAGAVGVGWVLLVDVRGLIFALPAFGIVCLAVLVSTNWTRRIGGAVTLVLVLAASYTIGSKTSWEETPSLEQQAAFYVDEALRRISPNDPEAGFEIGGVIYDSRFIWGQTEIGQVPGTLSYLWTLREMMPAGAANLPETRYTARTQVIPWLLPAALGLGLGLWGLRRRRWLMLGMLGTLCPFVVALQSSTMMVGHSRYIANGITAVPVMLGLGFSVLFAGGLARRDQGGEPGWRIADVWAICALSLLLLGILPSWLSPASTWRAPIAADVEPTNSLLAAASDAPLPTDIAPRCAAGLRADFDAGLPVGSRLLGWTASVSHHLGVQRRRENRASSRAEP